MYVLAHSGHLTEIIKFGYSLINYRFKISKL